jgi:hypothetical protein
LRGGGLSLLVLFKVLRIKPTAFLIAGILVAGVLMIGGVVVVANQRKAGDYAIRDSART